jgi:hypothetical protein
MAVKPTINGSSTPAQRRAIVLAGQRLGMGVDELRSLTRTGSLRALSFEQAGELLDRLNSGRQRPTTAAAGPSRSRRAARGVLRIITDRQREVIASYQDRLGWSDERLHEFLQRTFGLSALTLANRQDASRAITILRRIVDHQEGKGRLPGQAAVLESIGPAAIHRADRWCPSASPFPGAVHPREWQRAVQIEHEENL